MKQCQGCKKKIHWWQDSLEDDIPLVQRHWHTGCFLLVVYHQMNERLMDIQEHLWALCGKNEIKLTDGRSKTDGCKDCRETNCYHCKV